MKRIKYELLGPHVFVTKLAGFEHSEYIQHNQTNNKANNSDIPLVQGKNIRNGKFIEQYDWYIKKEISDYLIRSKLTKNCILVPYVGSNLGEVGIFYHPYDCHLASNIAKIELLDDYFELEYLKYYLQSPIGQNYLFQSKQGSAQPNITMESIRNTLVIDYPKHIQEKIISILRPIDLKIEANTRINTQLEELAKTIYDYWFLQFEFPNEEGKPYKSSGGKMVYNEQLKREIPEGWEVKSIRDISELVSGYPFKAEYFVSNGEYKIYTIKNVQDGYIDNKVDNTINFLPSDINSDCVLKLSDLIMSLTGNVGRVGLVYEEKTLLNQRVLKIKMDEQYFNYIYLTFRHFSFKDTMQKIAGGTSQKNLSPNQVGDYKIVIPSKLILNSFNNKLNNYFNKIILFLRENQELSSLRDFLLPLLMNGQVTFKDENEELKSENKKSSAISYIERFNQWKQMQGYAARGDVDDEILMKIFDAMDEDDKK